MAADPLLPESTPFVSVIIPVFNDSARLKLCLKALESQNYPAGYEVVVVDNGSTENIAEVCKLFRHAIYAHESKPGSYAARNKGIAVAKAEVFAFTDGDCIPRQDWLKKGVERLMSLSDSGLVGGKVELFAKNPDKPTAIELHESVFAFRQQKTIEEQNYSVTANLFTCRSIFDEVGLFNERLKSGGDREWCNRAVAAGHSLVYADDVVINHPARSSFSAMRNKQLRLAGGTMSRMIKEDPSLLYFLRTILRMLYYLPKVLFNFTRRKDLNLSTWQKLKVAYVMSSRRLLHVFGLVRLKLGGREYR